MEQIQESALTIDRPRMLHEQIREAIINAILSGELRPGDRIVESAVARQMHVSQATVREALRTIEQLGLIVSYPNRGTVVRALTRRDVVEMYEMRALLEGHAARVAATKLQDGDLERLEALVHDMVRLAEAEDLREMVSRDVAFHAMICQLADNRLLRQLWSAVHPHLWTQVAVRGVLGLAPSEVATRHFKVLDALQARDPERAQLAMQDHLLELRDLAEKNFPEDGGWPLTRRLKYTLALGGEGTTNVGPSEGLGLDTDQSYQGPGVADVRR